MAVTACVTPKETARPPPTGTGHVPPPCSASLSNSRPWVESVEQIPGQQHAQQLLPPQQPLQSQQPLQLQQARVHQLARGGRGALGRGALRRRAKECFNASERPGSGASTGNVHDSAAASARTWSHVSGGKRSSQPLPRLAVFQQKPDNASLLQQRKACKPKVAATTDPGGCHSLDITIAERGCCRSAAARRSRPTLVPPLREAAAASELVSASPPVTLEKAAAINYALTPNSSEAVSAAPPVHCGADAGCGEGQLVAAAAPYESLSEAITPGARPPKVVIPVETDDMALTTPPTETSSSVSSVKNSPQEPLGSDFSPPVLRRHSTIPAQASSAQASPLESTSLRYEPMPPSQARVRLCYDSLLDCYFDPVTGRYFELLS
mmetsp:Transcript_14029/g.23245  ORF Transcript_14029/g.23245 Transcript_14029/m.23245 type:complete len:380 (-) Transcript_14029:110-1249(-)|eukprot:CAMPEP_0119312622 /NCGR_PEP_ID=MMETSP1333-20130426/26918_1 /TAXON_ID=418940 /ORGANISM="Scyphosphaera apsteinii, Strain RCC1455" /LENGTH=379 /DNA_ID=CAMNT_0007317273 /DNA_START=141 /DNA_END=1280 /DNA_ORIENTATION=+